MVNNTLILEEKFPDGFAYIQDKSVDLIIADLPYGLTANKKDIRLPFGELWNQYNRVLKPNGAVLLFCQGLFFADVVNSNRKMFKYDLVWNKVLKTGHLNAKKMPLRQHEQIAVFYRDLSTYNPQFSIGKPLHSKGKNYMSKEIVNNNYGKVVPTDVSRKGSTQKYPSSILTFPKPHPSIARHRTEKPRELLRELILTYSNIGDTVLDNVMGCGNTGIEAAKSGRKFIGMENAEVFENAVSYFDIEKIEYKKITLW